MASRRSKSRRPKTVAASPKPPAVVADAVPAAPIQAQATQQAVEAILTDARRQADTLLTEAQTAAAGIVAQANSDRDAAASEAAGQAQSITMAAERRAEELLESAGRRAQQVREDAENTAAERQADAELAAQRIERAAQGRADQVREQAVAEGEALLADAKAEANRTGREAGHRAGVVLRGAQREADRLLADARAAASRAGAEADQILQGAVTAADRARRDADELKGEAQQLRADAAEYAQQRMQQAMSNASLLQEQVHTELGDAQALRADAEEYKAETLQMQAKAERALTEATSRTARRLHRKHLRAQGKADRRALRQQKNTDDGPRLSAIHWILVSLVVAGAGVIAAIGFVGSYDAVRDLAIAKGFDPDFAGWLPIGVDAGIGVLLALDLLLSYLRMSLPALRQAAWALTGATIAFNAAAAWPEPIGTGMHTVLPALFVVVMEAARHAISRMAAISAGEHTQTPTLVRWALGFRSTARMWRRQHLWAIRSLEVAVEDERQRAVYVRGLQTKYGTRFAWTCRGKGWRQKATGLDLLPLHHYDTGLRFAEALERQRQHAEQFGAVVSVERERAGERAQHEAKTLPVSAEERAHERGGERPDERVPERPRERAQKPSGERRERAQAKKQKSAGKSVTERRRERARRLYDDLGRRPEWTDIRDALVADKLAEKTISRPTIQRVREAIEADEPALAALGSENVRALSKTGSEDR